VSSFIRRFLPPETPDEALATVRCDFLSAVAKGTAAVGGAATAAIIAKKTLGADDYVVAMLYAAGSVGQLLTVWVPRLIGRRGTIRFIFRVETLAMAFMAFSAFMSTSWGFVATLAGAYALLSLLPPAFSRVYRQNYPTVIRGRLYAFARIGSTAATTICGFVVGRILDVQPGAYRWVYPAVGAAGLMGSFIFRRIRVRDEHAITNGVTTGRLRVYWQILAADRRFLVFLIDWAIFGFSNMMMEPVRAIYVTDARFALGADYLQSILILLVIPQATVLLTLRLWGAMLDRYPVHFVRMWQQSFGALGVIVYILAPRLQWLYVAAIFQGFHQAGAQLTWTLGMMEFAPRHQVTEYTTVHVLFTGIRGLIAPSVAAGLLALVGVHATFGVGLSGMTLSILLFAAFPRISERWPVPEGAPTPRRLRRIGA